MTWIAHSVRWTGATWLLVAAGLLACSRLTPDLDGRPCDGGLCVDGYLCHPTTNICVPKVFVSCSDLTGVCPSAVGDGDVCASPGSFIPCDSAATGCELGCRTCGTDGHWGRCTLGTSCTLGKITSCSGCADDCTRDIANAQPTCRATGETFACGYVAPCFPGFVDRDRREDNGCECVTSNDGVETCDGKDNDCDGDIDEASDAPCPSGALCESAACVPCIDTDPGHCGALCAACASEAPNCVGGVCVCTASSCSDGSVCEGGTCLGCGNTDPLHCGATCSVCTGERSVCSGGLCRCGASSCNAGRWCAPAGNCADCTATDPDHCGATCSYCAGDTPDCAGGICRCKGGSCPTGWRCATGGTCRPCNDATFCGPTCSPCPSDRPVCDPASGNCTCSQGSCAAGEFCNAGVCTACTCPAMFPLCLDTGDPFACRCDAASCGAWGNCTGGGATCQLSDDFEGATSFVELCDVATTVNSSWQRGVPTATAPFDTCNGGAGQCWGTNLGGDYNDCEKSCVRSQPLDLAGVTGTITLELQANYQLENTSSDAPYDGVTVGFGSDTTGNTLLFVDPVGGWGVPAIATSGCSWADPGLPGWMQLTEPPTATGWHTIQFNVPASTTDLFASGFRFHVIMLSDPGVSEPGIYVDDVVLRVTITP